MMSNNNAKRTYFSLLLWLMFEVVSGKQQCEWDNLS
jgi:hypothetical protein